MNFFPFRVNEVFSILVAINFSFSRSQRPTVIYDLHCLVEVHLKAQTTAFTFQDPHLRMKRLKSQPKRPL